MPQAQALPLPAPVESSTKPLGPPARSAGLHPSQIGLLSALRPWISAPCGSILAGLADRWGAHRFLLLFTYIAVTLIQAGAADERCGAATLCMVGV